MTTPPRRRSRILISESNRNLRLPTSVDGPPPRPFADFIHDAGAEVAQTAAEADSAAIFDHQPAVLRRLRSVGVGSHDCVLVRTEPPTVFPAQYRAFVTSRYRKVITVGGSPEVFGSGTAIVPWPQDFDLVQPEVRPWAERDGLAVMVSTDRGSPVQNNLYRLRREVAGRTSRDEVTIAGTMWEATPWQRAALRARTGAWAIRSGMVPDPRAVFDGMLGSYGPVVGRIPDGSKSTLLGRYRFNIAIENWIGYLSEKLFDAICAGCVPIYVGPDPTLWGVPAGAVIHVVPDVGAVLEAFHSTTESQAQDIVAEGQAWLRRPETMALSRDVVLRDLARMCLER